MFITYFCELNKSKLVMIPKDVSFFDNASFFKNTLLHVTCDLYSIYTYPLKIQPSLFGRQHKSISLEEDTKNIP